MTDSHPTCDTGSDDGKRSQDQSITNRIRTTRRDVLGGICTAGMGGLAGCIHSPGQALGSSPTPTPQKEFPGGVLRCQGDPVSVEETLPASEEPAAYFPSNDTVKYAALIGGEDIEYDTMSFERWKIIQTAEIAQNPVVSTLEDRIGAEVGSGLSRAPNAKGPSLCVWLFITDPEAIEGTRTPPVTLQEVAKTAPQSANVTLSVDEELFSRTEISRTVPVFAEHQAPARPG